MTIATDSIYKNSIEKSTDTKTETRREGPLYQLSVGLIKTYKDINNFYYTRKERKRDSFLELGTVLATPSGRKYKVKSFLGRGTFAHVFALIDTTEKAEGEMQKTAMKVVKIACSETMNIELEKEGQLLGLCRGQGVVQIEEAFTHEGRHCLILERLGPSVFDTFCKGKGEKKERIPLSTVRRVMRGVLKGMITARKAGIVQRDIKPENACMPLEEGRDAVLIDFSSAEFIEDLQPRKEYKHSRYYRPPEVILGTTSAEEGDIFSWALMLYELLAGVPLLKSRNEFDHLARICALIGNPSQYLLLVAKGEASYEVVCGAQRYKIISIKGKGDIVFSTEFSNVVEGYQKRNYSLSALFSHLQKARKQDCPAENSKDIESACDLMEKLLKWNPEERLSLAEIFIHPFLQEVPFRKETVVKGEPPPKREALSSEVVIS